MSQKARSNFPGCLANPIYSSFTPSWWFWQALTGVSLALTLGCKMVGLFTFLTIGVAVAIDLWNILDIRRGHTMVSTSHKILSC